MLLPVLVSHVVLLRAAWAVSPISKSFGKEMGFGMLWPLTAANLNIHPASGQRTKIQPVTTTYSACFVTR